jgi:hypothetical protein
MPGPARTTRRPSRLVIENLRSVPAGCRAGSVVTRGFASFSFQNSFLLSASIFLSGQSLISAHRLARTTDPEADDLLSEDSHLLQVAMTVVLSLESAHRLQIYAGYFLVALLVLLHCIACGIWQASHIEYTAILGCDPRYNQDWNSLAKDSIVRIGTVDIY